MPTYFSRYKTKFFVDPQLEVGANYLINQMGDNFILEGARDMGCGDMRIFFRDTKTNKLDSKIVPAIFDFSQKKIIAPTIVTTANAQLPEDNNFTITIK